MCEMFLQTIGQPVLQLLHCPNWDLYEFQPHSPRVVRPADLAGYFFRVLGAWQLQLQVDFFSNLQTNRAGEHHSALADVDRSSHELLSGGAGDRNRDLQWAAIITSFFPHHERIGRSERTPQQGLKQGLCQYEVSPGLEGDWHLIFVV